MIRPLSGGSVIRALAALFALAAAADAQRGRIAGTVTDSATGQPLPAVTVTVSGTNLAASTRDDGSYTIAGVPVGTHSVDARRLGHAPRTVRGVVVTADAETRVDFRLSEAVLQLQEVVTTGVVDPTAGVKVPFTVGRVTADQLPVPPANAVEAIAGKIAGVTVVPNGQPGSGTNIQLRTPSSINKTNFPLLVVDGVILASQDISTADLEALDIESIEVVKGAAAASLYGSRASNGVIQIRTRRGSMLPLGRTRFTARSEVGSSSIAAPIDYAKQHFYRVDAGGTTYVDATGAPIDRAARIEEPAFARIQDNPYPGRTYDQIRTFFRPGRTYVNSATLSQNNEATNWYAAFANHREDGVVLNGGGYARNDARLNLDHRLRSDLSFSASTYYSRSIRDELYDDTFFDLIFQPPDINLRESDPDGTRYIFQPDPRVEENPLYVNATQTNTRKRARTLASGDLRWSPLAWLSFDGNASFDRGDRLETFFRDRGVKVEGSPTGGVGEVSREQEITTAINASASANLIGRFRALTARSTLRVLTEREDYDSSFAGGQDLAAAGVNDLSNVRAPFPPASSAASIRSTGYFVTTGADWAGRYIADALVRRDGSSLFGADEKWHTYYRASAAWRVAEEPWFPWAAALNELKFRVSRGTAGGRPAFNDQYETYSIETGGTLTKNTLGNDELKPERATETEIGFDLIYRNRVSLQYSHARSTVTDQLILVPIEAAFGFISRWENAGTMKGWTDEATLEAQVLSRPEAKWRLAAVFDRSRHRITEFNRSCFTTSTIAFRCPGVSLGDMYGQSWMRSPDHLPPIHAASRDQFQVNDDGLLVPVGPGRSWRDGVADSLWGTNVVIDGVTYAWGLPIARQDASGNPAILRIGNSVPKHRMNFTSDLWWRGFNVYGLLGVQVAGHVYNRTKQRMYQWARSGDVDQAGKPDERKKSVAYYERLYNGNNVNDWFVENGHFWKLRELAVRYRIGQALLRPMSRFGMEQVSVALIGRNLWTNTDYSGYDPEVGGSVLRLDDFIYPPFRTLTGSIEIEF